MYKKYGIVILVLFCLANFAPYSFCQENKANTQLSLSLQDAITIAFKHNKDIQIQEQEIDIAKADILGAQSEFLPKVNLNAGYTHNGTILNLSSISSGALKKDIGVVSGYKNDNRLGISIDESVYNGGANMANFQQALLGLKVQEETLRSRKLEVEFETKRLYYGLLLAYETERIAQDLVNQSQSHYEDVKNKFEQGTSSRFDLLQSKVQVSKLMPELVRAKNAIDLIMADLKKLLGFKMQDSFSLKEKLSYSLIQIKEDEFLKLAYLNKPEMILKSLGIDISKWLIEMARAGNRPRVNADLDYSYRSNNLGNMLNNRHSNWNAGFTITIPIFDGFSTKAKVDAAKSRYAQEVLGKEDLNEQIAVDVRSACLDLKQAETIINSQKDNIEEAREALRIAQVSYDNGVGTNLDVLDAQVSLSQIEQNYSSAVYDYLMAKAYLDRTMAKGFFPPQIVADPPLAEEEAKNEKKD
jgi:outer membrane protein TolC